MNFYKKPKRLPPWLNTPTGQAYLEKEAARKKDRQHRLMQARKDRRKPLKPRSVSMGVKMREYRKLRKVFLCNDAGMPKLCFCCNRRKAEDVHHVRGRAGSLLLDQAHWLAVCRNCHNWIHSNLEQAQGLGWIAPAGQWGKQ